MPSDREVVVSTGEDTSRQRFSLNMLINAPWAQDRLQRFLDVAVRQRLGGMEQLLLNQGTLQGCQ